MAKGKVVYYEKGEWRIELRTRNNHAGYKVWILRSGYEISSLDERGMRHRCPSSKIPIPFEIENIARQAWDSIAEDVDEDTTRDPLPVPYSISL